MKTSIQEKTIATTALAGKPPLPARPSDRQRVEQLAPQILAARQRGWWIEQIAEALNEEFVQLGQPEINRSTFCKYISQLCTRARVSGQPQASSPTSTVTPHTHEQAGLAPTANDDTQHQSVMRSLRNPRSHGPL